MECRLVEYTHVCVGGRWRGGGNTKNHTNHAETMYDPPSCLFKVPLNRDHYTLSKVAFTSTQLTDDKTGRVVKQPFILCNSQVPSGAKDELI